MSRICVKGLPRYASEERLRELFRGAGEITDVKIARTKDGKSRQFAFVGFREQGLEAHLVRAHHGTCMDTARVCVEAAVPVSDEGARAAARSRHSKKKVAGQAGGSEATDGVDAGAQGGARTRGPHAMERALAGVRDKAKLAEFMSVMAASKSAHSWANDDKMRGAMLAPAARVRREAAEVHERGRAQSGDREKHVEGAATPSDTAPSTAVRAAAASKRSGAEAAHAAAGMSDLEYLRSRTTAAFSDSEDESAPVAHAEAAAPEGVVADASAGASATGKRPRASSADSAGKPAQRTKQPSTAPVRAVVPEADAGETGRLFVRNLPYSASEDALRAHFSPHGRLADVRMPVDSAGKLKGFAYVTYIIPEHAVLAMAAADGSVFQGRLLHVIAARAEDAFASTGSGDASGVTGPSSSFKRSREATRKAEAGTQAEERSVWSALFVRTDTTVAATAEQMGVARSEVLDRDADSMAVRMALAETQIVADTKAFLKEQHIDLDALEGALAEAARGKGSEGATLRRSNVSIIVKNLPFTADSDKLREMFARHGSILRFVMPPSRALAVVEFADAKCAKRAFGSLAYARYERVPLYLEWAPEKVFSRAATPAGTAPAPVAAVIGQKEAGAAGSGAAAGGGSATSAADAGAKRRRSALEEDGATARVPAASATVAPALEAPAEEGHTVYVKNVSFDSTEEGLRDMFASMGALRSVKIPRRRNPKYRADAAGAAAQPQWLSMGYGFVEFINPHDAKKAMKQLQGKELDGHQLSLKLSATKDAMEATGGAATKKGRSASVAATEASNTSTKLLVRNLAFEATKKDIQELFGAFGAVKTIRIPKKFDGSHRGFAFVEFLTHAEAEAAKAALTSTHLYGRHLVLEWAAAEDAAAPAGAAAAAK